MSFVQSPRMEKNIISCPFTDVRLKSMPILGKQECSESLLLIRNDWKSKANNISK